MSIDRTGPPKLFFNPLRSRFLWIITSAHLFLAVGLGQVFFFAPDEGGYLGIFKKTYSSGFSTSSVLGWSNSQTYILRILYAPAKLLSIIGVPDYLSIRILGIITSMLAIYFLMCAYQYESHAGFPLLAQLFFFTPSMFLWMTLGLRESFIYLSLSMICLGFLLISRTRIRLGFVLIIFGNLILFETKSYLFLLVAFATAIYLSLALLKSRRLDLASGLVMVAVLIPIIINPMGVKYLVDSIKGTVSSVSATGQVGIATVSEAQTHTASENVATTTSGLCSAVSSHPEGRLSKTVRFLGLADSCKSGSSGYRTSRLNVEPAKVGDPLSIGYRTAGFLFTPFPFIDNGSLFLNVAALESPFWWLLYGATGLFLWRRRRERYLDGVMVFCLTFTSVFILFSAFTEINVGTLARHRSVMVFPVFFLLASSSRSKNRSKTLLATD